MSTAKKAAKKSPRKQAKKTASSPRPTTQNRAKTYDLSHAYDMQYQMDELSRREGSEPQVCDFGAAVDAGVDIDAFGYVWPGGSVGVVTDQDTFAGRYKVGNDFLAWLRRIPKRADVHPEIYSSVYVFSPSGMTAIPTSDMRTTYNALLPQLPWQKPSWTRQEIPVDMLPAIAVGGGDSTVWLEVLGPSGPRRPTLRIVDKRKPGLLRGMAGKVRGEQYSYVDVPAGLDAEAMQYTVVEIMRDMGATRMYADAMSEGPYAEPANLCLDQAVESVATDQRGVPRRHDVPATDYHKRKRRINAMELPTTTKPPRSTRAPQPTSPVTPKRRRRNEMGWDMDFMVDDGAAFAGAALGSEEEQRMQRESKRRDAKKSTRKPRKRKLRRGEAPPAGILETTNPGVTLVPRAGSERGSRSWTVVSDGIEVGGVDQIRQGKQTKFAARTQHVDGKGSQVSVEMVDDINEAISKVLARWERSSARARARGEAPEKSASSSQGALPDLYESLKRKLMR